ncbi:hypothetical protein [Dipodfec virus UOA04_Rod_1087]|nr:hypothetical protein [Dipodfec virus UOA04_Rod_1087]
MILNLLSHMSSFLMIGFFLFFCVVLPTLFICLFINAIRKRK